MAGQKPVSRFRKRCGGQHPLHNDGHSFPFGSQPFGVSSKTSQSTCVRFHHHLPTARSADLQSAVSPICNRQTVQSSKNDRTSKRPHNAILRYSRFPICATGCAVPQDSAIRKPTFKSLHGFLQILASQPKEKTCPRRNTTKSNHNSRNVSSKCSVSCATDA